MYACGRVGVNDSADEKKDQENQGTDVPRVPDQAHTFRKTPKKSPICRPTYPKQSNLCPCQDFDLDGSIKVFIDHSSVCFPSKSIRAMYGFPAMPFDRMSAWRRPMGDVS